jgi:hypothetical protein
MNTIHFLDVYSMSKKFRNVLCFTGMIFFYFLIETSFTLLLSLIFFLNLFRSEDISYEISVSFSAEKPLLTEVLRMVYVATQLELCQVVGSNFQRLVQYQDHQSEDNVYRMAIRNTHKI